VQGSSNAVRGSHGLASGDRRSDPHDRLFSYSVVLAGGLMLREFLVHPTTRRIDWWMIALLLVSLLSFAGATILLIHPV